MVTGVFISKKMLYECGKGLPFGLCLKGHSCSERQRKGSAKVLVVIKGSVSLSLCPALPSAFQLFTGYCPPCEAPQVGDRHQNTESPPGSRSLFLTLLSKLSSAGIPRSGRCEHLL